MDNDSRLPSTPFVARASTVGLQHLRYAVAAADHGSFRRAADALLLRQSTLSRCIRQLEGSIGIVVFDRSSGGVRATETGRTFLREARSILGQLDALIAATQTSGRGEAGRLTIGFYTSLSAGNLRATLLDFKQRFPQVELGTVERSRMQLVTSLRHGALDIAIVTGEAALESNNVLPLWSERVLVALPENHSLADRDTIYWTDLRSKIVLLSQYDPGRELEDLLMSKLVSPEDRPKIERHDVSRAIIKSLVSVGFGISLVTESDIGASFSGLIYRDLRDGAGASRIGYSAHWRSDNDNPALASFLRFLGERYPSPS
ncbi:MAG: LysR family transcriptional regulator [Bradyrhizobium sp.]|uniref:LysR family transcriptional regulator n=1 Tax=unclassified Bradyrhizobium TaxID=2631580 RepID=UPI000769F6E3|nr:LysR family transcriptional regulator [Bradyrhizobium sp. CCH5-F6]